MEIESWLFKLRGFISEITLRDKVLIVGAIALLGLGVVNVSRYLTHRNSIDYLSRKAFSEVREYWRTQAGSDPQERWWAFFWRLSQESEPGESRQRAASIALSMLGNMERWDQILELTSNLAPDDPVLERSHTVIGRAYAGSHGESAYIGFLTRTIRSHPNKALRAKSALALARLFLENRRYQAAAAVLGGFDFNAHPVDDELENWWKAAQFELEHLRPGMPAPPFELTDVEGRSLISSDLKGSPFILLFWSPTCGPSSLLFDALYTAAPKGIQVVAVSKKSAESVDASPQKQGFRLVYDQEPATKWNVYATPTALLFDQEGRLIGKAHAAAELAALVDSLP